MFFEKVVRELPTFEQCSSWFFRKVIWKLLTVSLICLILYLALSDRYMSGKYSSAKNIHRLAIIVPFRNALTELFEFAPHIHSFLERQNVNHQIFVIHQVDEYRFNRASLINVGFLESSKEGFDYLALHDVDLLPLNANLSYGFPNEGVVHLSSPKLHPQYHYEKFLGGILLITRKHFSKVNGMSNRYWGWGLEDDEFRVRLMKNGIKIYRPKDISTSTKDTFLHLHNVKARKRDMKNIDNQRQKTNRMDKVTGINNIKYKLQSSVDMKISEVPVKVLNVELQCDITMTPWCINKS